MLRALRRRHLYDNTLIILMSDHGEAFGEHGSLGHDASLFEEMIRIPLIVKLPRSLHGGVVVSEMARGVDIFPTVLDVVGLDPIPGLGGSSLLRLMRGYYDDFQVAISQKALAQGRFSIAIRSNRWKLFENRLYDLVADPGETTSVGREYRIVRKALRQRMQAAAAADALVPAGEIELDEELRQSLRALGYIQ